jgi:biopolymer transport protein ExbD
MFQFAPRRRASRISLTPMIDVVFLLLVFFMLVARFGLDQAVPLRLGLGGGEWQGPPRLLDVAPDALRLNGVPQDARDLLVELVALTESGADPVILRPVEGASLGRLVEVMGLLRTAGFDNLAVTEAGE